MRHLSIALVLIFGLAACNMTTGSQSSEQLSSEIIAQSTNTPVTVRPSATAQSAAPTNTPRLLNTTVPQSVAAPVLPSCAVRADWQVYTIASGDTLSQIAQRSGTDTSTLAAANCLSDANAISVGQALRVPSMPAPVPANTDPTNLRMVGDFAGRPSLEACWASNPGTKPLVYDAIDGKAIAYLSNRVIVISATPTWVQVDLQGTMSIPATTGWMRVADVHFIGACAKLTGVQLDSFEGFFFGNPAGVPDGLCAVVITDPMKPARVYDAANGWMIGSLNGWARWVSTQDHFYQFQVDSVAGLDSPGPFYGWVDASETYLHGC